MDDQGHRKEIPREDVHRIREEVQVQVDRERAQYGGEAGSPRRFSSDDVLRALDDQQDGDAWIYVHLHRGRLVYDHAIGQWYEWQGHHWALDRVKESMAMIDGVVEVYGQESLHLGWEAQKAAKKGNKEAVKSLERVQEKLLTRIANLQRLARKKSVLELSTAGKDSLGISGEEWDRNPWIIGCRNGVVELKTGNFREGRPEEYVKTVAPVDWAGLEAEAPHWEQFVKDILGGAEELVHYLQRLMGYAISGDTREHVLPIFWGEGRNGKGTLLETLGHLLGPLAGPVEAELLLAQKYNKASGGPTSDIMALRGRRLAWASETGDGRKINASKVKWLVGGDSLVGRAPFGRHEVNFQPTHTLILLTNHKPQVPADDYALWQRIHLVPFTMKFVDEPVGPDERQRDPSLAEKLNAEGPGILAWLVRGCLEWQSQGLNPPEIVKAATAEYRLDEALLGSFLADCCVIAGNVQVKAGEFYKAYRAWCEENGHRPLSSKQFGTKMKIRFDSHTSNGVHYIGVGLTAKEDR
jgi:putative DNA primase/helicase